MVRMVCGEDGLSWAGADPVDERWGARPPPGTELHYSTIQDTLFNSIQPPVRYWAPSPGRNPESAPGEDYS